MSDTTGWRGGGRACNYMKDINGRRYEIHRGRDGNWWIWTYNTNLGTHEYLADAQVAAHEHARETK